MTTFVIPIMFLQCLAWNAQDGDTISGFRFEQPVTIIASQASHVEINRSEFIMGPFCWAIEAKENSAVDTGNLSFSGSGAGILNAAPPTTPQQ